MRLRQHSDNASTHFKNIVAINYFTALIGARGGPSKTGVICSFGAPMKAGIISIHNLVRTLKALKWI